MTYKDLKSLNGMVRAEVVPYYVDLILDRETDTPENPEVLRINNLIIEKWSLSALTYIKEQAWYAAGVMVKAGLLKIANTQPT